MLSWGQELPLSEPDPGSSSGSFAGARRWSVVRLLLRPVREDAVELGGRLLDDCGSRGVLIGRAEASDLLGGTDHLGDCSADFAVTTWTLVFPRCFAVGLGCEGA